MQHVTICLRMFQVSRIVAARRSTEVYFADIQQKFIIFRLGSSENSRENYPNRSHSKDQTQINLPLALIISKTKTLSIMARPIWSDQIGLAKRRVKNA